MAHLICDLLVNVHKKWMVMNNCAAKIVQLMLFKVLICKVIDKNDCFFNFEGRKERFDFGRPKVEGGV